MRLSVVIPCHNGAELTRACIASLLRQQHAEADEILIVDNASHDDTGRLDGVAARVRVLPQPHNRGFAGGVNAGIAAARGEFVLVLNNDTQAATNLLAELLRTLTSQPDLGAVAPVSNHVKGHALLAVGDLGRASAGRAELQQALAARPALQDVSTLAGLCLLVRRSTFATVGTFDERFGHGNYEDDDFCLRLRLHGLRLGIAARAFLHHEGHATFRHLGLDLREELTRRRAQFTAKWQGDPAGRAHLAALAGDAEGAADAARLARLAYPRWADADWHLGEWYGRSGAHEPAIRHLEALLRQCPHHVDGQLALLRSALATHDRERTQRVLAALDGAAATAAQQATALRLLGDDAYRRNDLDDAIAHFAAAKEIAPDDAQLEHWLGLCHLGRDHVAAAAQHFATAAAGGIAIAFNNLGICRARQGDRRGARACFAEAQRLLPDDPAPRANAAALGCTP